MTNSASYTVTEAVGWNRTASPSGGRGLQRIVADHAGSFGAAIGGSADGCGYVYTTGNWSCSVSAAKVVWLWVKGVDDSAL